MKTALLALVVFCFYPHLAYGEPVESAHSESTRPEIVEWVESAHGDTDTFPVNCSVAPVPNISGWEVVQQSRIEFRLSGETIAYLGLDVEHRTYRNPDSGESMRVFSRHIPFIPSRPKQINERIFSEVATALYVQKDEEDRLGEIDRNTDSFLYVYWRVQKNPRNGNDMLDGDVNIWFMSSNGSCHFMQNEPVRIQFLSESVGNTKSRNVFLGVRYKVGEAYHFLKVDRRDVVNLMEGGK